MNVTNPTMSKQKPNFVQDAKSGRNPEKDDKDEWWIARINPDLQRSISKKLTRQRAVNNKMEDLIDVNDQQVMNH